MLLGRYLVFTVVLGLIVGAFSAISDILPYQDVSFNDIAIRFTAELLNDLVIWLGLTVLVGYLFCRSVKQAVLRGAGFAVFTIIIFFILELFSLDRALEVERFIAHVTEWSLVAAAGGIVGGLIGFMSRQYPSVLLLYPAIVTWRLMMRVEAWQNPASALGNIVLIAIALASVGFVIMRSIRIKKAIAYPLAKRHRQLPGGNSRRG